MINHLTVIRAYAPENAQEMTDKGCILELCEKHGDEILNRSCRYAHITSSGFIMNPRLNKTLMVHHNIRGVWGWTGGHADGDGDLLSVAVKEAREETGALNIRPLFEKAASLDILTVRGHEKNGRFINAHLHLSVSYILICGEEEELRSMPGENTGVAWFDIKEINPDNFSPSDVYLYNKLIKRASAFL